jgi:hypothetical protein
MSVFSQNSAALDRLHAEWTGGLQVELSEQVEILTDLEQQLSRSSIDFEVLEGIHAPASEVAAKIDAFSKALAPLRDALKKFLHKANEGRKDPDKQMYGPAMLKNIDASNAKLDELTAAFDPLLEQFTQAYGKLNAEIEKQRKEKESKEKAAKEAEEARLAAERAAKEAADRAAAEKARQEAEARARREAEEKARREAEAAEKARVEKAEKERVEREARALRETELAARREREEAEKKAREESEAKDREAAEAGKSLTERCRDRLKAALESMKSALSPGDFTIAVQTLLKFLSNIMNSPMEERFRTIRVNNDLFQRRLASKPGGTDALKAIGFQLIRTPDNVPASSELKPNEEYYKIEPKAELWPVLVDAKKQLENAMADNRSRDPALAAAAGAAAGSPAGAAAARQPPAFTFPGLGGLFPPMPSPNAAAGGTTPAGAGAGAPPAGLAGLMSNPMAMMSDPFLQRMMR